MADNDIMKRALGMLGLAMKAGKVVIGTEQVIAYLQKNKLKLVLLSSNSSEGTQKKIRFKCEFYKIDAQELPVDTEQLGRLLGKTYTPAAVGVTDEGFSRTIVKILGEENEQ